MGSIPKWRKMNTKKKIKNCLWYADGTMLLMLLIFVIAIFSLNFHPKELKYVHIFAYILGWMSARVILTIDWKNFTDENKELKNNSLYRNIIIYVIIFGITSYFSFVAFILSFIGVFAYRKLFFLFVIKIHQKVKE